MFALVALVPTAVARAQDPSWLREFGSFTDDAAFAVSPTDDGGCFVVGHTLGFWFPGGVDPEDIFLARFDGSGGFQWGVQFGAAGDDTAYASIADGSGGVFLAGETGGSFGGPYAGGKDAWFARCGPAGNRVWVRQIGTSGWDQARALAPDGKGGVFVAGFANTPSAGAYNWIARYTGAGSETWLHQFPPGGFYALESDGAAGFFAAGSTATSLGGPYMGAGDAWVGRFDSTGDLVWARQLGTAAGEWAQGLTYDGYSVFVAGMTQGSLGGPHLGEFDAWVARFDSSGQQLGIRQFGTPQADGAGLVTRDGMGGIFMAANTNGALGGPNAGSADVWVAHLDAGLNIQWIDQFGSSVHDQTGPCGIAIAEPGSVFVCGWTLGNIPGSGGGGGGTDAWLARYDMCYSDCNADGAMTVADFGCFQTRFMTSDMYADCNANGVLTVQDFGCFQTKFVVGCP